MATSFYHTHAAPMEMLLDEVIARCTKDAGLFKMAKDRINQTYSHLYAFTVTMADNEFLEYQHVIEMRHSHDNCAFPGTGVCTEEFLLGSSKVPGGVDLVCVRGFIKLDDRMFIEKVKDMVSVSAARGNFESDIIPRVEEVEDINYFEQVARRKVIRMGSVSKLSSACDSPNREVSFEVFTEEQVRSDSEVFPTTPKRKRDGVGSSGSYKQAKKEDD